MTKLSVRVGLMAACCLLLATAPSRAQIEAVFNVPVVVTEGVVAHPDGTVYFTDLRGDRILQLGTNGLITTYRQPANNPNGLRLDAQFGTARRGTGATRSGTRPAESLGRISRPGASRCSRTTPERLTSAGRTT